MMLGARTGAWGGKALPYDAEVEYLESTGTQYINDVAKTKTDFWFEIDIQITLFNDNNIGSIGSYGEHNCYLNFYGNKVYPRRGVGFPKGSFIGTSRRILRLDATGFYVDGALQPQTFNTLSGGGSFYIFGARKPSNNISFQLCKIFAFRCGPDMQTTSVDFIPVRVVGDVGYMYDRVSGQLFGNAGTGAFVIGPDKT